MHGLLGHDTGQLSDPWESLSPREGEVAQLVAQGLSNVAIAQKLCISKRTVESHVRSIKLKLGLANRYQLIVWGMSKTSSE